MKQKHFWKVLLCMLISFMLVSCATAPKKTAEFNALDLNGKVNSGQLVQSVDNFIVILDASGSIDDMVASQKKLATEKNILTWMNQTMPDLKLTGELRTFGKGLTNASKDKTRLIYGPTGYTKNGFQDAIGTVKKAEGLSWMQSAIEAASDDMKAFTGKTAVIILSDGKIDGNDPVKAATNMKSKYGDNVCIYTVFIPSPTADIKTVQDNKDLLKKVAEKGGCGFAEESNNINDPAKMAGFVERVFLSSVSDADGDGVPNNMDQCPDTPKGVKVDARGCPIDSDMDGVPDYLDKCPNTPRGVEVDRWGCPVEAGRPQPSQPTVGDSDGDGVPDDQDACPDTPAGARVNHKGCWVISNVLFDYNKSNIKREFNPLLDEVVEILTMNPGLNITVEGHTDNIGGMKYNMGLSKNRAESVMNYLIKRGISRSRLSSAAFAFTRPVAPNDTPEGRAMNRRVELTPIR